MKTPTEGKVGTAGLVVSRKIRLVPNMVEVPTGAETRGLWCMGLLLPILYEKKSSRDGIGLGLDPG